MIIAKLFCQTAAGQAQQPGVSTKVARMIGVPNTVANGQAVPSPNADLFVATGGNITLDMSGLKGATFVEFEEGATYTVTITRDE